MGCLCCSFVSRRTIYTKNTPGIIGSRNVKIVGSQSTRPVLDLLKRTRMDISDVRRHKNCSQGVGMGGNEQVIRTDSLA